MKPYFDLQSSDHGYRLHVTVRNEQDEEERYQVTEPLAITTAVGGVLDDFQRELGQIASQANAKTIKDHIEELAKLRVRILFATEKGMPKITDDIDKIILRSRTRVFRVLLAFLVVDLGARRQEFAQQTLDAFLKMLELVPEATNDLNSA